MRRNVAMDYFFESGFVNRNLTSLQCLNLARVVIDTDDMMTDVGKTRAGDKANVSGTNYREIHREKRKRPLLVAEKQPVSRGKT